MDSLILIIDLSSRPILSSHVYPSAPHHRVIVPVIVELQLALSVVVDAGGQEGFRRSLNAAIVQGAMSPGPRSRLAEFLQPTLGADIVDADLIGINR